MMGKDYCSREMQFRNNFLPSIADLDFELSQWQAVLVVKTGQYSGNLRNLY